MSEPIYLISGHGEEITGPFETREKVPEGCCVVLFTTAGNTLFMSYTEGATRFMQLFSNPSNDSLLRHPSLYKRLLQKHLTFESETGKNAVSIRVYKSGDYLPTLRLSPSLTWTEKLRKTHFKNTTSESFYASEIRIAKSGIYRFPTLPPLEDTKIKEAFQVLRDNAHTDVKFFIQRYAKMPYMIRLYYQVPESDAIEQPLESFLDTLQETIYDQSLLPPKDRLFQMEEHELTVQGHTKTILTPNIEENIESTTPLSHYLHTFGNGIYYVIACRYIKHDLLITKKDRAFFFKSYRRIKALFQEKILYPVDSPISMTESPPLRFRGVGADRSSTRIQEHIRRLNLHHPMPLEKDIELIPLWNDMYELIQWIRQILPESETEPVYGLKSIEQKFKEKMDWLYSATHQRTRLMSDLQQRNPSAKQKRPL